MNTERARVHAARRRKNGRASKAEDGRDRRGSKGRQNLTTRQHRKKGIPGCSAGRDEHVIVDRIPTSHPSKYVLSMHR